MKELIKKPFLNLKERLFEKNLFYESSEIKSPHSKSY